MCQFIMLTTSVSISNSLKCICAKFGDFFPGSFIVMRKNHVLGLICVRYPQIGFKNNSHAAFFKNSDQHCLEYICTKFHAFFLKVHDIFPRWPSMIRC